MTMKVNVHEAKTKFSKLLARVAKGEEVIIMKAGKPVARLVPLTVAAGPRPLGMDAGRFAVPEDFDAPLPADLQASFES